MLRKERQHGNSHVSREEWKRHHEQEERQSSERGQALLCHGYLAYKEVGLENISWTKGIQGSVGCQSSYTDITCWGGDSSGHKPLRESLF